MNQANNLRPSTIRSKRTRSVFSLDVPSWGKQTASSRALFIATTLLASCANHKDSLRILSSTGELALSVSITRATSEKELSEGLRARPPLREGEGLLLVFPEEGELCITNEGVPYAIDAIFADMRGRVTGIARDIPADESTLQCRAQSQSILELRAGESSDVMLGYQVARR